MTAPAVRPTLQGQAAAREWGDFSASPASFGIVLNFGEQPDPAMANTLRGGPGVQVLAHKATGPRNTSTLG